MVHSNRLSGTVSWEICHENKCTADAHFLVWVIELTHFLSISVCWFWFWFLQTKSEKVAEPRFNGKTKSAILE